MGGSLFPGCKIRGENSQGVKYGVKIPRVKIQGENSQGVKYGVKIPGENSGWKFRVKIQGENSYGEKYMYQGQKSQGEK